MVQSPLFRLKLILHFVHQVPESGGSVETNRIHVAWSPVWRFHSQWWFGLPCNLLVLVHCVFSGPQSTQQSTMKFWSTLCFRLLNFYGDADFIFQQNFSSCPHCQTPSGLLTMILLCLIGQPACLTWTPSGIYGIFSRERWETVALTIQMSWRLNSASAEPQADRFHTSLMLEFVMKEPRPSIECRNEHTLKNLNVSVLQILF